MKSNLVLIGMPTSGKTTIGKLVADSLRLPFFDSDSLLEERFGSIPTLITEKGEEYFRYRESEIIKELADRENCVIACGGGTVIRSENMELLRKKGRIVWLKRDMDRLKADPSRPLSSTREKLEKLYRERKHLYEKYGDLVIDNNGNKKDTVSSILQHVHSYMKITPSRLNGEIVIPASKSLLHRYLIMAAFAEGKSVIRNITLSDDIEQTIEILQKCGAGIRKYRDRITVSGGNLHSPADAHCGDSGSTLRLLLPLLCGFNDRIVFRGSRRLLERPLDTYEKIAARQGIMFEKGSDQLTVQGAFSGGQYVIRDAASSQFVSGLLLYLPLAQEDSVIDIEDVRSRPYIDMTIACLREAGITVIMEDNKIYVPGRQKYRPFEVTVDGDYSHLANWLSAGILNGPICVRGFIKDGRQGDRKLIDVLRKAGAEISDVDDGYMIRPSDIGQIEFDGNDYPDVIMPLCILGLKNRVRIRGVNRLKYKESDRLKAIKTVLSQMGLAVYSRSDSLTVRFKEDLRDEICVDSYNDHRIMMMEVLLSSCLQKNVYVSGYSCIRKSYPDFPDDCRRLGLQWEVVDRF